MNSAQTEVIQRRFETPEPYVSLHFLGAEHYAR
jgi:hypothetical protein